MAIPIHLSIATTVMLEDKLEESLETTWAKEIVPLEALERALYALADRATGNISDSETGWIVTLWPRGPKADTAVLAHALRQEVNDQTLRVKIAERTEPIRNLVFALAFSRSGLVKTPTEQ